MSILRWDWSTLRAQGARSASVLPTAYYRKFFASRTGVVILVGEILEMVRLSKQEQAADRGAIRDQGTIRHELCHFNPATGNDGIFKKFPGPIRL